MGTKGEREEGKRDKSTEAGEEGTGRGGRYEGERERELVKRAARSALGGSPAIFSPRV